MPHLDEGTIHAWLDGALSEQDAAAAEAHVAQCSACAAAVAEARGLIAASSRILTALDLVPGDVIPASPASSIPRAHHWSRRPAFRAGIAMAAAAVGIFWIVRDTPPPQSFSPPAHQDSVPESIPMPSGDTRQLNAGISQPLSVAALDRDTQSRDAGKSSFSQAQAAKRSSSPVLSGGTASTGNVQQERTDAPDTFSPAQPRLRSRTSQPLSAMVAATPSHPSPDSPAFMQSHECAGITVSVYSIGISKLVTLINTPDTIPIRRPTPALKSQPTPRPLNASELSRSTQPSFLVPGLDHCSSDVRQIAQSDSTAKVLRWTDPEHKRAYVLQGPVSRDTLSLVRRAITRLKPASDTVKK